MPRTSPRDTAKLRREIERLRRRNEELERDHERLERENGELRKQVELLGKSTMRPAAPFRIPDDERKKTPRRPGRKSGHPGACRQRPEAVDAEVVAELSGCPHCGEAVEDCRPVEQFIEDLPVVKPHVTRIVTFAGRCHRCGPVVSKHPMQMSSARGAAAVQLGPRAVGLAIDLNKRLGLPLRKTCDVIQSHFGLQVTPGALVHAEARLAARLAPEYTKIVRGLRSSAAVYTDETSWWVGGPGHWLWVFTSDKRTIYVVDQRRNNSVVKEILGERFTGVLSSDCLNIYDLLPYRQNKCYAHHLKATSKAIADARGDTTHLERIRSMLRLAIAGGKVRGDIPESRYATFIGSMEKMADTLLASDIVDIEAQKVMQRLRKQRDHLFTFLRTNCVSPTNNAAERALRPAVVARKVSCGNRTDRGRVTWQTLASLAATCGQNGVPFARYIELAAPLAARPPSMFHPTGPPSS